MPVCLRADLRLDILLRERRPQWMAEAAVESCQMGWCQEFGVQIRAGCDHVMVPGDDSCSCSECGTVCPGRFAGCSIVWRTGATPVDSRNGRRVLPARATGSPSFAAPSEHSVVGGAAVNGGHPLNGGRSSNGGDIGPDADPLTGRVTSGRGSEDPDLWELYTHLYAEVQHLRLEVKHLGEVPPLDEATILRQVDARFQWLTKELSNRLVVLGNEIGAIKRRLGMMTDAAG